MKFRGIYIWIVSVVCAFLVLLFVSVGISYSSKDIVERKGEAASSSVVVTRTDNSDLVRVGIAGWGIIGFGLFGIIVTIFFGKRKMNVSKRQRSRVKKSVFGRQNFKRHRRRTAYQDYYHERAVERRM